MTNTWDKMRVDLEEAFPRDTTPCYLEMNSLTKTALQELLTMHPERSTQIDDFRGLDVLKNDKVEIRLVRILNRDMRVIKVVAL